MPEKASCPACPRTDVSVNADGRLRMHAADGKRVTATNTACPGVYPAPAPDQIRPGSGLSFVCRVPAGPQGCGHQVQLTANHRARTHLTPQGTPCPEGSSAFAIAVDSDGFRADTADWNDAQWAALDRENGAEESANGNKCAETGIG